MAERKYQHSMFVFPPNDQSVAYKKSIKDNMMMCEAAYTELEADIAAGIIRDVVPFGQDKFINAPVEEVMHNIEKWYEFYETALYKMDNREKEGTSGGLTDNVVDEIISSIQKYVNQGFAGGPSPTYSRDEENKFIEYLFGQIEQSDPYYDSAKPSHPYYEDIEPDFDDDFDIDDLDDFDYDE